MSAATITLLFLLFAVVMFVFEKIPLGVTSMIVCIGLVVTGVLDVKTAFAGFIDSNVILFVAMFIVGGALFETGMANKIGGIVTHFAKSERSLIVAIMVIVGLMSGVLSNTGTAAVLIPVVIGIAAKSGYARSKLLMPLVFAAAMGGNLSLIGAPGNLIAQSALGEIGMSFGFFEYAIVGLPILAVGILFYATLGMKLLPNHPVSDDDSFGGEQNFSNVPKWKQMLSLVILVLTLLGMIFEKQIGIKLNIIGCIGALALILTGVISEKDALKSMKRNQKLAKELNRPSCQDTGVLQFWVKCGVDFPLIGEVEGLLKEAVVKSTFEAPLRHNSVETFDEFNTGLNVGKGTPTVWWDIIPNSDKCEIYAYMAGGGCTLPGKAMVLMPGAGYEGVTKFVMDVMTSYGINACPPLLVGVGVATSVETAALLSKKALMRPLGSHNENERAAYMEKLLEDGINSIGLGPQGMGGKYSVMGVHIENTARHPSAIGVAVNVGCWSHRRGHIIFDKDLNYTIDTHSGVTL